MLPHFLPYIFVRLITGLKSVSTLLEEVCLVFYFTDAHTLPSLTFMVESYRIVYLAEPDTRTRSIKVMPSEIFTLPAFMTQQPCLCANPVNGP